MERLNGAESFRDKLRAFALALALHVLCVAALLAGLWWTHEVRPVTMPGPVIEATLVGPTAAPKSAASAPRTAPPKPAPEPPRPAPPPPSPPTPEASKPSEVPRQDQVDQEKIAAIAEQKAQQQKREQEEKQRQRQIELDQEQKEKQAREEKARKLKEEQLKQLADLRKQREDAEKALKQETSKLRNLENSNRVARDDRPAQLQAEHESQEAQTGAGGKDDDLMARYTAAIQAVVTQRWNRPDNAEQGLRCTLKIVQIPGGDVLSVEIASPCNADPLTRSSIEQAVKRAAPLPYKGYEKVFRRELNFNFSFDG
jgi:colicin import membrane protein